MSDPQTTPPASPETSTDASTAHADELKTAKQYLTGGRFNDAINVLDGILAASPAHFDALYMCAVAQRYANKLGDARATLDKIFAIAPEFGRAFQEQGHLYRAEGNLDDALRAYQIACQHNPGLEASWKNQADILTSKGRTAEASNAIGYYQRLKNMPRELHAVTNLLHEGKLVQAERACKAYMMRDKLNVEGMRLLAEIASRFRAKDEAELLYSTAIELDPKNVMVRMDYVTFLRKTQQPQKALDEAKFLNETYPDNPTLQSSFAIQSLEVGDYETALSMFDAVLDKVPNDPMTLTSRGHALKTYGRQDDAIASYQRAYRAKPDHGDAYFSLSNLKTYRFSDEEIDQMEGALTSRGATLQNQAHLRFALGKAFEDRKEYGASFEHYKHGNDLKRFQSRYRAEQMTEELEAQAEFCTPALFEKHRGGGCPAPDPIFIVGLPRAGSTLLEQILASHSQVDGTLELPNILALAHQLRGRHTTAETSEYPRKLIETPSEEFKAMGEKFIEDTRIHRAGAPYFIDKMPNNFRHIGLIHLILPNAKIIDARRHPMDCCFSGFKQHFAEGQEFTYGLEQIGAYYRDYVHLMRHWDEVLPGRVLRVQYEDVVADLETQVRRLLDFCDLEFEDACINFHKTDRAVRTASSEQVRQPINTKGIEQWRGFEPFLDPLKEALGETLTSYRD